MLLQIMQIFFHLGAFTIDPKIHENTITIAATSLSGESFGFGTLANITFEVIAPKFSTITLSNVRLTDAFGNKTYAYVQSTHITEPSLQQGDLNGDGVVNIQDLTLVALNFGETGDNLADVNDDQVVDIVDLTLVAAAMGASSASPAKWNPDNVTTLTRFTVEQWIQDAKELNLYDPTLQQGILVLEQLLATLIPEKTVLLPNYPNPFNPETWIPFELAIPGDITIQIHSSDGQLVRNFHLGFHSAGVYQSRDKAAFWNGKNNIGESVSSGLYFYTLTAGDFTATRKMIIRK